jgi:hypothetical protein
MVAGMRDAFGEIDPDEVDRHDAQPGTVAGNGTPTATRRRSRAVVATTVGLALALAGVGLVVWQLSSDDETGASESSVADEVLTDRLVIATPPDGFRLSSSFVGGATTSDERDFSVFTDQRTEGLILAGDGATLDDGPLLAFYASADDRFAAETDLDDQEGEAVDINGLPGRYVDEGSELLLTFGPDDDGYLYITVGIGVPRAQLEAFARSIDVDGGLPTIRDPEAINDFEVIADINTFFSVLSPMLGDPGSAPGNVVTYEDGAGSNVALWSAPNPGNVEALVGMLGETSTIDIDGNPGWVTEMSEDFGATVISRVVDGRLIMVGGTLDLAQLAAAAESVRPATDEEWQAVLDVAGAGDSNVGGG